MKLYYFTDACSLAVHIALRETRQAFSLKAVDYATKQLADGTDFASINPKGSVPALVLDNGKVLTEVCVILQYVAAQSGNPALLPAEGGLERYRCLEWLNYVATELHKSVSPLYRSTTPASFMQPARDHLRARFDFVEAVLSQHAYLCAERYSVADIYLYVVSRWLSALQIDTARWTALQDFCARVERRQAVQAALSAEGLVTTSARDSGTGDG